MTLTSRCASVGCLGAQTLFTLVGQDGGMRFQDLSDVQRLIDQRVREVSALEFKSDAPLDSDEAKKKLLRDITSMGNSGGGTLIFGLTSDDSSGFARAKIIGRSAMGWSISGVTQSPTERPTNTSAPSSTSARRRLAVLTAKREL